MCRAEMLGIVDKIVALVCDKLQVKNSFEWGLSMITHSDDAIQVTKHVANFFVCEARKSVNQASARRVLDSLIYNHSPTYCRKAGRGYDEVCIFT